MMRSNILDILFFLMEEIISKSQPRIEKGLSFCHLLLLLVYPLNPSDCAILFVSAPCAVSKR